MLQQTRSRFDDYDGKLVWQGYGDLIREPDDPDQGKQLKFTGYDVVGLSLMGCDDYLFAWDNYIEQVVAWADESGTSEIMVAEMGCVAPPQSVETALSNYDYWVSATHEYSTGVILLDSPSFNGEYGIVGSWQEDWIVELSEQYLE